MKQIDILTLLNDYQERGGINGKQKYCSPKKEGEKVSITSWIILIIVTFAIGYMIGFEHYQQIASKKEKLNYEKINNLSFNKGVRVGERIGFLQARKEFNLQKNCSSKKCF